MFSEVTIGETITDNKRTDKGNGESYSAHHTSKGKVLKNLKKLDY